MFYHPVSWLEKLGKTIAIIHASEDYQRYIQRRKRRILNKQFRADEVGRYKNYISDFSDRSCLECGSEFRKSKLKRCIPCSRKLIIGLYRSGLSIELITKKFECCSATIVRYLRSGTTAKPPFISVQNMMLVGERNLIRSDQVADKYPALLAFRSKGTYRMARVR